MSLLRTVGNDDNQVTVGRVQHVAIGANGLLYFLDSSDFDVKVFDAEGKFIRKFGPVPALAGKDFVARWKDKTLAQVIARFEEGVKAFPPEGRSSETAVEITAYALQTCGAKPGDRVLTRSTDVTVGSIAP